MTLIINFQSLSLGQTLSKVIGGALRLSYKNIYVYICMHAQLLNHVLHFVIPWTVACQAPLSMGFFRQEYWSGLPFPPPGGSSQPRDQNCFLRLLHWQEDSLPLSHLGSYICVYMKRP